MLGCSTLQAGAATHRMGVGLGLVGNIGPSWLVGVRGWWQPAVTVDTERWKVALTALEVSPLLGRRHELGRWALAWLAGPLFSQRDVTATVPQRMNPTNVSHVAIGGQLVGQLSVDLGQRLSAVVELAGQRFAWSTGMSWLGEELEPAPTWVGSLRVGVRGWL